jgi:5-methylcytosine-specific restriction endonuclease McrA
MEFERYIQTLPTKKLSRVKRIILQTLWGTNGNTFPRPWITSQTLLEQTQQKYFDRRIRELRDDLGCDLETKYVSTLQDHAWRLQSPTLQPPKPRSYLTVRQKVDLFKRHDFSCAICGVTIAAEERGLQADHKVPISRGGRRDLNNWQPLCQDCNVAKRRACQGCDLPCESCVWAYPETVGIRTTIAFRESTLRRLDRFVQATQGNRDAITNDAVDRYLDTADMGDRTVSEDDETEDKP